MGMANALTELRLGGPDGAWQFFTGYILAVRMAGEMARGDEPTLPVCAALVHGDEWARRVDEYALDLAVEALTTEGSER